MLVSQPAVQSAVGVHEDLDGVGLIESPDITAGPVDQQHVLERFVSSHFTHITNKSERLTLYDKGLSTSCLAKIVHRMWRHNGLTRSCEHNSSRTIHDGYFMLLFIGRY